MYISSKFIDVQYTFKYYQVLSISENRTLVRKQHTLNEIQTRMENFREYFTKIDIEIIEFSYLIRSWLNSNHDCAFDTQMKPYQVFPAVEWSLRRRIFHPKYILE